MDKKDYLRKLTEEEFREEILIPLLKRMGYEQVRHEHGTHEYGKDIIFQKSDDLSILSYAVVAKIGDISGAASGKGNLAVIREQINQAFNISAKDVTNPRTKEYQVNKVIIWTTGKISIQAREQIMSDRSGAYINVDFKDLDATLELLEKHYPEFFSIRDANIASYFAAAKKHYNKLEELASFGIYADKHLPSVFVAPVFERYTRKRSRQAEKESLPRQQVPFSKLVDDTNRAIILGEMGSGKTTILRKLMVNQIEKNERNGDKFPLPIFLRCLNIFSQPQPEIMPAICEEFAKHSTSEETLDVDKLMGEGKIVLLLDGLDELQTQEEMRQALNYLSTLTEKYPSVRIVMTSRPVEMFRTSNPLPNFQILRIRSMTKQQVEKLVKNWFEGEPEIASELNHLLSHPMTYSSVMNTPLTIALVAAIHQSKLYDLPSNLTELFQQYSELALGRWDISKNISNKYDWQVKEMILRRAAWDMQTHKALTISRQELHQCITRIKDYSGLPIDSDDSETFLEEITKRSGLLNSIDGEVFESSHRTLNK